MSGPQWLVPDWDAPRHVRVVSTLRVGGASLGPYASLNLAAHVGDDAARVAENRRRLREAAQLPGEPLWLSQVHGRDVVVHDGRTDLIRADAAVAKASGRVCAVLTADCLPVVLTDKRGVAVGIAHAGWRGLLQGVIEATVAAMGAAAAELQAWLGPAIGQDAFEVGVEVRDAYLGRDPAAVDFFRANERGRYQ